MLRFLGRKILWGFMIVIGALLIMFLMIHFIPGSPWANYSTSPRVQLNRDIDTTLQNELNRRFGLNLPLWRQFTRYLIGDINLDGSLFCGAICGNLGPSIQQHGRTVQAIIFGPPVGQTFWQSRFGYSVRLVFFGTLILIGLGVPLGIYSALKPKSWLSHLISVGLAAFSSIPNFVLGLLAIILLASWLHLIPVLPDWNVPGNWIVPAFILALMPMAGIARVTRISILNVINEDYVRTARGKGLTWQRITLDHIVRNALVPIITSFGPTLMEMFVGLFIVESLYSFPGMGREYWKAVLALDYPMILGLTLVYAIGIVCINIINQLVCERLDPRIHGIEQGEAP